MKSEDIEQDSNCILIKSVSEYINEILSLREHIMDEFSESKYWFFRGQKCSLWSVRPNIFRNNVVRTEYEIIQQALRRCPFDFRDYDSQFDKLTKLQHYGLGTRLLDVTLNPLVALYFASEPFEEIERGKDTSANLVSRNGKVFYKYEYGHKLDELPVRIASAIPFMKLENNTNLYSFCDMLCQHSIIDERNKKFLQSENFKPLIEIIQSSSFVISSYNNERLVRQSGAFLVPTAIHIVQDRPNVGECVVQRAHCDLDGEFESEAFIIPAEYKESIREELDFLNINEATLFPELEHQLSYLQNRGVQSNISSIPFEPFVENLIDVHEVSENCSILTPHPDVAKIVSLYLADNTECRVNVEQMINETISNTTDWWVKDSAVSRIKRNVMRILQGNYSKMKSQNIADNIVKLLCEPGEQYQIDKPRE